MIGPAKPVLDSPCPECGYRGELASSLSGENITPKEDDFSLCLNCGLLVVFGGGLVRRQASAEELAQVLDEERAALDTAIIHIRERGRFYP